MCFIRCERMVSSKCYADRLKVTFVIRVEYGVWVRCSQDSRRPISKRTKDQFRLILLGWPVTVAKHLP